LTFFIRVIKLSRIHRVNKNKSAKMGTLPGGEERGGRISIHSGNISPPPISHYHGDYVEQGFLQLPEEVCKTPNNTLLFCDLLPLRKNCNTSA
jgi:hypothetical protein